VNLSTRFLVPAALLALAAGAIVWPRWLSPQRIDPCAHPEVLEVTGLIPGSHPDRERRDQHSADIIQWSEGTIPDTSFPRNPLQFRIVRNYNVLKAAEGAPSLLGRVESETARIEHVEAPGGPLPVHVIHGSGRESFQVIAYLYALGNEPVRLPFLAQLSAAVNELRGGRLPLTIFIAGGSTSAQTVEHREKLALDWLGAAWLHYRGMCLEDGGSRIVTPRDARAEP
jgi:hypothetical protein